MQFSSSLTVLLFSTLAALTTAQYADDHFLRARDAVTEAKFAYLDARSDFEVMKRLGGNGECSKPSSAGKSHCMKGGRSCAAKGCSSRAHQGDYCLCDAGYVGH